MRAVLRALEIWAALHQRKTLGKRLPIEFWVNIAPESRRE